MLGSSAFRMSVTPGGALAGPWVKNPLWSTARAVPSLDLPFADTKSLTDAVTGQSLVTFTRASSGTYVGSDGVLRTATTNLLLRSEEFDNAYWTKTNSTVTANATTAPNGALTAEKLITNSGASSGRVSVSITATADTPATLSCYAKQGETNIFGLFISDGITGRAADFNLTTGTVSGTPTAGMTASIQPVGDGWYRCVATVAGASLSGTTRSLRIVQTVVANDGTSGLFIWGAQFEQSTTAGEYIPTTSTINSAPRFDHNPTTGESLGLLVEEQRTNSIRNNTMVGAVAGTPGTLPTNWIGAGSSGLSREVIGAGTESGIAYVDVRYFGTTTSALFQNVSFEVSNQIAAAQSSIWTSTAFVKLVGGSLANITSVKLVIDNYNSSNVGLGQYAIGNFVPTTAALVTQRYSVSSTSSTFSNAATAFVRPYLQFEANSGVAIDITLRIGLPQLEQGAFATSVIPTSTAAATRSADVASITGTAFSSWYRQDEGTVFASTSVSAIAPATSLQTQYAIHDGSTDNRLTIYKRASADTSTRLDITAATVSSAFINAGTFGLNNLTASAIRANDFAVSLNGLSAVVDTSGNVPSVNQITLGSYVGATGFINGTIRRLTYWPARLSNPTIQAITQ